jgi:opacity protein-like surface antigen
VQIKSRRGASLVNRSDIFVGALLLSLIAGCAQLPKSASSNQVLPKLDPAIAPSASQVVARLPPADSPSNSGQNTVGEQIVEPTNYRWRERPFSGGYAVGAIAGDPFHSGHVDDALGLALTKRYGWDFADHWGLETRLTEAWLNDSTRFNANVTQTERALFWDTHVLYYPWADTRFRPYVTLGAGLADFSVTNDQNHHVSRALADVPFGFGVKYPIKDWLVVRAELLDDLTIGGGELPTMNNVSLTGGVEIRFGDIWRHFLPWLSGNEPSTPSR